MSLLKPTSDTPAVYFKDLTIANIRCFKEEQTISFTNAKGEPAQWTVILGNNNTGKTTLLRCLYDMEKRTYRLNDKKKQIVMSQEMPKIWEDIFTSSRVNTIYKLKNENPPKNLCNFYIKRRKEFISINEPHGLESQGTVATHKEIPLFHIDAYGIPRIKSEEGLSDIKHNGDNPFATRVKLINTQEWLMQTDYIAKSNNGFSKKAKKRLDQIKKILKDILPDVKDFRFQTTETDNGFKSWVEFKTDYGWVRLKDLGYGYQSLMTWMVDFAIRLFNRYPNSDNPLAESAIALVDEIDLHLHPDWQRIVIGHLSKHFPRTQFIVTAHSPLVIQSADEVNVVLLEADKENGRVLINQPEIENYQGWTVEEILTEIMGLGDKVRSDDYLRLMEKFDQALDDENYDAAMQAYDALDKILHPYSNQRKLMNLQLTSIKPVVFA